MARVSSSGDDFRRIIPVLEGVCQGIALGASPGPSAPRHACVVVCAAEGCGHAKRNYYNTTPYGWSCGEVLQSNEPAPLGQVATMDACIGTVSGARVTWRLTWLRTDIYGRVARKTGQTYDGSEWHHFGYVPLTWYLPTTTIGARLTPTSGDTDLYTRMLLNPNLNDYDCRPYRGGTSVETCEELGFVRNFSVHNYSSSQTSTYHLELLRDGFIAPI